VRRPGVAGSGGVGIRRVARGTFIYLYGQLTRTDCEHQLANNPSAGSPSIGPFEMRGSAAAVPWSFAIE